MRSRIPDPTETWTYDEARWVLDEWRRSGETIAAFARKHGVVAERLYWWRKKLAASRPQRMAMGTLSLIPATIVSTSGSAVTIRLPGEVAIEVANASPRWVAAVVAELTRSS